EAIVEERVVERIIERRRSFFPALIGGLLAATIGFLAARTEVLDSYLPGWLQLPNLSEQIAGVDTKVTAQSGDVTQLSETVAALDARTAAITVPDIAPLVSDVSALSEQVAPLVTSTEGLSTQVSDLDGKANDLDTKVSGIADTFNALQTRLSDLEKRPITEGVSEAAIAAYEREVAAMQAAIAQQRGEVEALIEKTRADVQAIADEARADAQALQDDARAKEEAARAAEAAAEVKVQAAANKAQAALLRAALDEGAPYGDVIAALEQGGVSVPAELGATSDDGVVTMAALQAEFPGAARAALKSARSADTAEPGNVTSFLQRQLGARSVEPRDGDGADAVLSRIEAAVTSGQLGAALDEITTLPDAAKAALATWSDQAQTRFDALQAAESLVQSLNTN
ncbi:MAG: COG4223 family protein, partial [Sedimentitalea sp.]